MKDFYNNLITRRKLLEQLEQKRNSRILVYHSQRALEYHEMSEVYETLLKIGKVPHIELFLSSGGGDIDAAHKFVSLVRQHCEKFTVIVPFLAKSAASLISIGADEIHMGPISELGPIDPQIKHPESNIWGPAQAIRDFLSFVENRIANSKEQNITATILMPTLEKLDPWLLGNFERAVLVSRQYANRLLSKGMLLGKDSEEIERVTNILNEGYFSHGYAIDRHEARTELGLKIIDIPEEHWILVWQLYSEYNTFRDLTRFRDSIIECKEQIEHFLRSEGIDESTDDDQTTIETEAMVAASEEEVIPD